MAGYSARQSTYTTGDVVEAADTNDEFTAILAAFDAITGHAHDGSAGEGPLLTTVGALVSGSITATFGNIDNGTSNITSGGIWTVDVDGTAIGAAGSINFGAAGNDAAVYFDGTNLVIDTTTKIDFSVSGTSLGTWDTDGIDLASGDSYQINAASVLSATTLGSGVTASSLTSVGTLTGGSIASGFGSIDIGSNAITATGTWTGPSGTWDSGGIDIATGDTYAINGTDVLSATTLGSGVVYSSLTSVGVLASPVFTTPQINDTSADHQYVFAVSELAADRTVTLPLLTGNDEFTFNDHSQTLTNKSLTAPTITGTWTATGATCSDGGTVTTIDIDGGSVDAVTLGTNSAITAAQIDNINIDGNTISSTDTNGNIVLSPNGNGVISGSGAAYRTGQTTLTSSSNSIAIDFADNNHFVHTLTENTTLANPSNIAVGQTGTIFFTQDASSAFTLSYGSYWDFIGGSAPSMSTTLSSVCRLDYVVRTTTSIHAILSSDYS